MTPIKPPEAIAGMLIRKSPETCFEAFVDPAVTANFWFTRSTGRLDAGQPITWTWDMYDVSSSVRPLEVVSPEKIVVEWGEPGEAATVTWRFISVPDGTFVDIRVTNLAGDEAAQMKAAIDMTDGFAIVLCGMKAWLEQGVRLNAVADRWPKMPPGAISME